MQSGSDLGYRNSPRSLTHARMNTLLTQSSPCEVSQSPCPSPRPASVLNWKRARSCSATSLCPPPGRSRRSRHLRRTTLHRAAVHAASRRTSGRTTACAKQGCRRSERSQFGRRRPLSPCPPQAGCWYSRLERRPYVRLIVLGNGPRHAIGLGPRIPKQPSEFDTCPNEYALDPKLPM